MNAKVERSLNAALHHWRSMSGSDHTDAEAIANVFESSFYSFIDAVRQWFNGLDQPPHTLEDVLELPMITEIIALLPAPLYLNFETEMELIVEHQMRIDDDKYD